MASPGILPIYRTRLLYANVLPRREVRLGRWLGHSVSNMLSEIHVQFSGKGTFTYPRVEMPLISVCCSFTLMNCENCQRTPSSPVSPQTISSRSYFPTCLGGKVPLSWRLHVTDDSDAGIPKFLHEKLRYFDGMHAARRCKSISETRSKTSLLADFREEKGSSVRCSTP